MTDATVLIVDDEKHTRDGLRMSLEDEFDVYTAADAAEAEEHLRSNSIEVLVTDLKLGADDGMKLIDRALSMPSPPVCIMMTAYGSVETAVEAMKRGAYHFVTKPLNIDELEILIKRALKSRDMESENIALKRQVDKTFGIDNIVGKSAPMEQVFDTIRQVAPTRATVLIQGEHGTGKELAAHALHNLSGRPKSKLVIVHCAALSPQLLESELFGHERGSFTGAAERRIGRFESADGGTLFLDEIGEIDASTQVKLLRALGERTIERVGGSTPIKVDVRLIAASNKNLKELAQKGEFREDLYYRLNVVTLTMPPLRKRKEDIIPLVSSFLKEFATENNKECRELTSEAMACLLDHDWPGNVRELRTVIEHGVVMSNGPKVTLRHLPASVKGGDDSTPAVDSALPGMPTGDDAFNLDAMEERMIRAALAKKNGNRTEAAKLLGVSRRTLQRKLKAWGDKDEEEENSAP